MHCERCNLDFAEGLRYCKWCGEPLVDRPRVTSELHSCPSCAAAVQPGWAYCKSCGEPLRAATRKPAGAVCPRCGAVTDPGSHTCSRCEQDLTGQAAPQPPDSADSSGTAMCSSCGERLDTGSLYCKACGSAVHAQEKPFGESSLLCAACNSYSPVGSNVCRVCGTPFGRAPQTVIDRAVSPPPVQQRSDTLPDLDEQLLAREIQTRLEEQPDADSGARTLTFAGDASTSRSKRSVETSLLPGTAGYKSEQQVTTSIVHMGRTTGSVEEETGEAEALHAGSDVDDEPTIPEPVEAGQTIEFAGAPPQTGTQEATTSGLGAESTSSRVDSEGSTRVFVSPSPEATREFQAPGAAQQSSATPDLEQAEIQTVEQVTSQPLPKKRTGMVIASAVVAVIVIGLAAYVAWWFVFSRGRPTQSTPPSTTSIASEPVTPPPPEKPPAPVIAPEGMVSVAAGTYTIGRDKADPLERPQHKVDLPAFFIDRTEVTNAAYKKFVDATGHQPPSNWSGTSYLEGRDNFPVTGVTWQDAADYAAWAGKRLPTEAEWEAAARGSDGRIYPWGNDWRPSVANIGLKADDLTKDQYPPGIAEAGRYADGASPAGAVDMIGNAWEWTADEFALYPGGITAIPKDIRDLMKPGLTYRVIRGGAYDGNKKHDATYRGLLSADESYPKVGFRCAKDAK